MADISSEDDIASFNDSDQFDDDSLSIYSWFSEHDSVSAITWNGWKKNSNAQTGVHSSSISNAVMYYKIKKLFVFVGWLVGRLFKDFLCISCLVMQRRTK